MHDVLKTTPKVELYYLEKMEFVLFGAPEGSLHSYVCNGGFYSSWVNNRSVMQNVIDAS